MANSITKFKAYIDKLDTVYQQASATSILDADADTVRMGATAGEFLIPKISMDGLADYSRSNGYVQGDVTITYETKSCNYDRGRKFSVDAMDNEESAGIAFGKLASEFIRTKAVSEMDAFRFAKYASATGILSAAEATPTAGASVLTALQTAVNAQDEAEVNADGKIAVQGKQHTKLRHTPILRLHIKHQIMFMYRKKRKKRKKRKRQARQALRKKVLQAQSLKAL